MESKKIITDKIWFTDGGWAYYSYGDTKLPKPPEGVQYAGATSLRPLNILPAKGVVVVGVDKPQ